MFILAEGDCVSNMTVFGNEEGISQEGNMTEYIRHFDGRRTGEGMHIEGRRDAEGMMNEG